MTMNMTVKDLAVLAAQNGLSVDIIGDGDGETYYVGLNIDATRNSGTGVFFVRKQGSNELENFTCETQD